MMLRLKAVIALAAFAALLCIGCNSKIVGQTSTPPPPGGPKASERHPPGETQSVLNQDKGK